jgi:SAM-dependent methyltransferase
VLEIAAGTGQHAVHFTASEPGWRWLATDPNPEHVASIAAYAHDTGLPNLLPPARLDVLERPWEVSSVDVVFCANMIHIAPWACAQALVAEASRALRPGGLLVLYGPFRVGGAHTSESNASFHASLRSQDPDWGVRDLEAVDGLACGAGLESAERFAMPANNQIVTWRRSVKVEGSGAGES